MEVLVYTSHHHRLQGLMNYYLSITPLLNIGICPKL